MTAENPIVSAAETIEQRSEIYRDSRSLWRYWTNALTLADRQEEHWRKTADEATKIYRADPSANPAFNILHSNVETIVPAMYNSTPEPDVRTKHNDANEFARRAGQVLERGIRVQRDEYDFDSVILSAVRDAQIAGRGVVRVAYKPYYRADPELGEVVAWEEAACAHVPWRSFRRGPGAAWSEIPWVAFETFLTRDELIGLCQQSDPENGYGIAMEVPLDASEGDIGSGKDEREKSAFRKARVWQVWDKDTKKVFFIAPGFDRGPLHVMDDPLGLTGFFPCPMPLQAISDPDTMVPVTPYEVYRKQAAELAEVSERILGLLGALKFRGIRASEVPEIDDLENLEDGEFVPSRGAMALLGGGQGLNDAIWVVPVEKLILVLRELIAQREHIKSAIFEISGLADILRGSSDPRETLGAQQIKSNWGSLRIQQQQRDVQRFCRDLFRLKAEIIANKFSENTLALIAGEPLSPEIVQLLRNDAHRAYTIDIETDSTIRGDLVRAQQNMTQFLQGTAQFMGSFVQLIQTNTLPPQIAQVAVVIYAAFSRQFKLGKQVEDALAKLAEATQAQPIGQPTPQQMAEQEEAKQISKAQAVARIKDIEAAAQKKQAETAETVARTHAQQVETGLAQIGVTPPGFVQ